GGEVGDCRLHPHLVIPRLVRGTHRSARAMAGMGPADRPRDDGLGKHRSTGMRGCLALAGLALLVAAAPAAAQTLTLAATPSRGAWGNYDAAHKPALTVRSGDTVVVHTLLTNSPAGLERNGVPADQVQASLRAVYDGVTDRGPGGHILTGPIYVEGAEPG